MKSEVKYSIFILFFFLFGLNSLSFAQTKSREQLEKEKRDNLAKIKEAESVLQQTRQQKSSSLSQVRALNEKIISQEQQIYLMEQDLELIDVEMQELQGSIGQLEEKLHYLQKEYADMIYRSSKISGRINQLSFILSASSFTELVMRYKYIQQYADNREQQIIQINKVTALLKEREGNLQNKRSSKAQVKKNQEVEIANLESLKKQKSVTINELSKKEKELRQDIAISQRSIKRLDQLISSIISREVTRKNKIKEARKDNPTAEIPEVELRGNSFANNKKRLPWPVQSGFISDRFGVKNHPVLAGVKIDNNGIDIQTPNNATVRTVFDGTVMDISDIPGLGKVVTIQHGDYYTVYANLEQVFVTPNQAVNAKETIGTAGIKDGVRQINFQIWNQFQRQNPELWLTNR